MAPDERQLQPKAAFQPRHETPDCLRWAVIAEEMVGFPDSARKITKNQSQVNMRETSSPKETQIRQAARSAKCRVGGRSGRRQVIHQFRRG